MGIALGIAVFAGLFTFAVQRERINYIEKQLEWRTNDRDSYYKETNRLHQIIAEAGFYVQEPQEPQKPKAKLVKAPKQKKGRGGYVSPFGSAVGYTGYGY